MKAGRIYVLVLFLATLFACAEQDIEATKAADPLTQEVYFEVMHTNNAWQPVRKGFIVDNTGGIRTYSNPAAWNEAGNAKGQILTSSQIRQNFENTIASDIKVDAAQFKTFASKIPALSTANYTKRVETGKDKGQTHFYAYQYDSKREAYVPILLNETGDWNSRNTDQSAIEMSEWLQHILSSVQ